jgi:hypothetical protein
MYCPRSNLFVSSVAVVLKPIYVLVLGGSIRTIIYAEETEGIDYTRQLPKCHIEENANAVYIPPIPAPASAQNNLTIPFGQLVGQEGDTCSLYSSDAS